MRGLIKRRTGIRRLREAHSGINRTAAAGSWRTHISSVGIAGTVNVSCISFFQLPDMKKETKLKNSFNLNGNLLGTSGCFYGDESGRSAPGDVRMIQGPRIGCFRVRVNLPYGIHRSDSSRHHRPETRCVRSYWNYLARKGQLATFTLFSQLRDHLSDMRGKDIHADAGGVTSCSCCIATAVCFQRRDIRDYGDL